MYAVTWCAGFVQGCAAQKGQLHTVSSHSDEVCKNAARSVRSCCAARAAMARNTVDPIAAQSCEAERRSI